MRVLVFALPAVLFVTGCAGAGGPFGRARPS
jgi:hypothetical protein